MILSKPQCDWTLENWLSYLEKKSPQHLIKLGLERVLSVAQHLNIVPLTATVITVAGTNGKGSTVAALEHIYHHAGYKVGSYTSPHLIRFNERIKVNLNPIEDQPLCDLFYLIESASKEIDLTYFELSTLAALLHFKRMNLDIVILEVGLGGRLDAVNIIDADLSIITTIDYDHQELLGKTLNEIGSEKAGILRQFKPFIYADVNPPASILDKAEALQTQTYLFNKDFFFLEQKSTWDFSSEDFNCIGLTKPKIQLKAASAAIRASSILKTRLPVPDKILYKAMDTVFIPGRLQFTVLDSVHILYDVSHNPQSVKLLAQTIQNFKNSKNRNKENKVSQKFKIQAVFAALKDKDLLSMFQILKEDVDCWHLSQLDTVRAATVEYSLVQAKKAEISSVLCYTHPPIAFKAALGQSNPGDLIVVFGSFFTVGEVLSFQNELEEEKGII